MVKTEFTDEDCEDIKNAMDTLGSLSGFMKEKLCRDENGKIIKYGEMTLDLLEDNIKRDIINLNGIHNKRCEFVEAREGLEALFGGGRSRAKK